ncbi:MAG: amino acid permease [Candidatus Obscuribacterales bacterium]|nr:amino acid permease [Candidatus Obscuribacterales bacterium]
MNKTIARLFRRKPVQSMVDEAAAEQAAAGDHPTGTQGLRKVLTARDVFAAGLAAIIGTGIFILTGVAAHDHAGPAVILSFVIASVACAIVAFSYAELSSMIPVSGSAYTYTYATLGELFAWLIGWDLVLEYAVGASCVAVGWSAYLQSVLKTMGLALPAVLSKAPAHVPWPSVLAAVFCIVGGIMAYNGGRKLGNKLLGAAMAAIGLGCGIHAGMHIDSIDVLAIGIVGLLTLFLIRGVRESLKMTSVFVVIKLLVISIFIALGIGHVNPANLVPFMPFGLPGLLTGAAVVFFAYIGFDGVSTLAEECRDPQRDLPKGILGSLAVSTVLYILVALVTVGAVSYTALGGSAAAAPLAHVLELLDYKWAVPLLSVGALAGLTSVLIVSILAQSRVLMRMSKDGLLPPVFSRINAKTGTPRVGLIICAVVIATAAGLLNVSELALLTNIGTLAAFVLVCSGVVILRKKEPAWPRKFRCPGAPYLPIAGAVASFALMLCLPLDSWIRFFVWMGLGLIVYFAYSRKRSLLQKQQSD